MLISKQDATPASCVLLMSPRSDDRTGLGDHALTHKAVPGLEDIKGLCLGGGPHPSCPEGSNTKPHERRGAQARWWMKHEPSLSLGFGKHQLPEGSRPMTCGDYRDNQRMTNSFPQNPESGRDRNIRTVGKTARPSAASQRNQAFPPPSRASRSPSMKRRPLSNRERRRSPMNLTSPNSIASRE